jgi:flagellar biosynthetic protein FliR
VEFSIASMTLAGYLLALCRTVGFILTAPPFNTRAIPGQVRAGVAVALAIPLSTWTTSDRTPGLTTDAMAIQAVFQILFGAVLGFFVLLAVAAIQTIGDLIDVAGGFSITVGLDPLQMVQNSVMGRLHQLIAITLLFVGDGHLVVLQGLSRSIQLRPGTALDFSVVAGAVTSAISSLFLAAIQITSPILAALLIADIALGLLTRAAPALNAFALAFPLKITLSLFLIGLVLTQVPGALAHFVNQAALTMLQLSGG